MSSAPPKPKWESAPTTNATASSSKLPASDAASGAIASVSTRDSDTAPRIPDRPAEFGSTALSTPAYSAMQSNPYQSRMGMGATGYGGYGGGVSSYGGYGGGYGGYGAAGGYGGLSRLGGGYGGYGMGGYGVGNMGGPGEGLPNLTSSLQQSTAPAFAIIESLVTAFTSLAQLVESTYMATHSSFFAMVGVADQLGSVKSYLGQVLGVFSILRLGRRMLAWIRGQKAETISQVGWANEWSSGVQGIGGRGTGSGPNGEKRPSSKPLILFLLSAVGLPYLMSRLVRLLIRHQQEQQAALAQSQGQGQLVDGQPLDPSKLTFARAKWEFKAAEEWELSLGSDEIVAVLEARGGASAGPTGGGRDEERGWWRGRTRDGRAGWFPGNYVEVIRRKDGSGEGR